MFRIDQEAIQLPGMLRIIMSDTIATMLKSTPGVAPFQGLGVNLYYKACFCTIQSGQNKGVATFHGS